MLGPCNWAGRRCAFVKNPPSTPGRQLTSSAKKTRSDTQGNLASRGRTGKDHLESRYDRHIVVRSQNETEKIENSSMLRPAEKNDRPHSRRCGVVTARENLTAPLGRLVQWSLQTEEQRRSSTFATTIRDEGEGQTMHNSGVRDLKRRAWSMPGNPDEARFRRKSGDLAGNRSTKDQKKHTHLVSSPEGRERQPPGRNATLQVRRALRNY